MNMLVTITPSIGSGEVTINFESCTYDHIMNHLKTYFPFWKILNIKTI